MRILFRTDSSVRIGGGHAMRCLALADELRRHGAETMFVTGEMLDSVAGRIEAAGHRLARIEPAGAPAPEGAGWEQHRWSKARQQADAERTGEAFGPCDWAVMDRYQLDEIWSGAARSFARKIFVIDDLANRAHDCDLLLDQNLGRSAAEYRPLVPRRARVLAGPFFALIRPEFAALRPSALDRRRTPEGSPRLLLSLGSTDIDGVTGEILENLLSAGVTGPVAVMFGSSAAESLGRARKLAESHPNVAIHVTPEHIAELVSDADLAIGAAGVSAWERCCLGLPSINLIVAENQRAGAEALAAAGAAVTVTDARQAAAAAAALLADSDRRAAMAAASAAITDGRGLGRVMALLDGSADAAASAGAELRPATSDDCERLWLWRNDPLMRAMARSSEVIPWTDHVRWFERRVVDRCGLFLVAELAGEPIGMVRFDQQEANAPLLVSINVAPERRGGGLGGRILADACILADRTLDRPALEAEIHADNVSSQRIFAAAGFVPAGSADGPYLRFIRRGIAA